MFSTAVFKSVLLIFCLISLCGVFAFPDLKTVENYSVDNATLYRSKRQAEAANTLLNNGVGSGLATLVKQWDDLSDTPNCKDYGCHCDGGECNCWAYCRAVIASDTTEWCYTSKPGRGTYKTKTPCTQKSDCDGCWSCSSGCTVFN